MTASVSLTYRPSMRRDARTARGRVDPRSLRASVRVVLLVSGMGGCATAPSVTAKGPSSLEATRTSAEVPGAIGPLMAIADAHWDRRDDQRELSQAIMVWEKALELDPDHAPALTALARACYFLGYGVLAFEADNPEIEFAAYEKGFDYAERALFVLEPEFERLIRADAAWEHAVARLESPGVVEPAYWYAVNIGRYASKQGLATQVHYRDRVRVMMERVQALSPGFHHRGPDRFLGAFYAALTPQAGQNLERSEGHFAAARAARGALMSLVLEAQFLAVATQDRDRFERLLREVLARSPGTDPDLAPENRVAQRAARLMLERADDLF